MTTLSLTGTTSSLNRLINRLPQPHPSITNNAGKQRSRLLAWLLLLTIVSGVVILAIAMTSGARFGEDPELIAGTIGLSLDFGLYLLNQRGKISQAAVGYILLSFLAFIFVPLVPGASNSLLAFAAVPILLAAIFFATRAVYLTSIGICVVVFILNRFAQSSAFTVIWYYLIFSSVLLVTFICHQQAVEEIHRRELETANRKLRESEDRLQQINSDLERRVAERTRDLAAKNTGLEQASEAAKKADRVKSQFLASMSHELRTPLNAILNFTESVNVGMLGPVNEKQKDALSKSLDSGRHLLSLINDVLDITKIESGMMRLFVEENIDLNEILEAAQTTTQMLLQDKPVTFTASIDPNLPVINGDRRRIRQVLRNLLSNACKFSEEGSVTFSAKNEGSAILFSVIDTGSGIAKEDQTLIFEPFKQTATGIQQAGATGLGLPISKRLLEVHGGEIWVDSDAGKGAAFYARLPIRSENLVRLLAGVQ